jgi:integrase
MYKLNTKTIIGLSSGKHHDGRGLYISIKTKGLGKWSYRYRLHKVSREMGLGRFPDVSLREARERADDARRMVARSKDPLVEKKKAKILQEQKQNQRFSDFANMFIDTNKSAWRNPKSEQQWRNTINTYALPILDKKPFSDINKDDVIEVLLPIWVSKTETARRLQQRLSRIFVFAKTREWYFKDDPASWRGHLVNVLPDPYKIQRRKHHASLHQKEAPLFFKQLMERGTLSALALKLQMLTATRTKEIIQAEFDEFDLDRRVRTIPEEKMKAGKEHSIPLSDQAVTIINTVRRLHNHKYLFTNIDTGRHISNGAMLVFLKKNFPSLKITVHGFRSTFTNWAEEQGKYPFNAIDFCLAHQLPSQVIKAYLRTDLFPIRKQIMQDWANYLMNGTDYN